MQKKLIAMAVAGLVAAPVFAQSNVTIYGRVDYGYMVRHGDNGGSPDVERTAEFGSGLQAGSRLGFKGAEDLGNGLKAIFQLEYSTTIDNSTGGLSGIRNAYVGLTGNFGTVVGGHLDGVRYGVFNKYDAFGGGNVGNFTQMTGQVDRASNAIAYISPSFNGLTATLAYSTHIGDKNPLGLGTQENPGNDGDAVLNTAMLGYENGPISANIDFERVLFNSGGAAGSTAALVQDVKVFTVAGSYDFGVVKVSALYDILRVDDRTDSDGIDAEADVRTWFVSVKAPVGQAVVLKATYGRTEDDETDDTDASKWGIGADYNLSKRTNLYLTYGSIRQDDNSSIQLSQSGNGFASGYGVRGFDLGIAHKF
jgi:predicted porin